jgi:protein-disulfide isomerase
VALAEAEERLRRALRSWHSRPQRGCWLDRPLDATHDHVVGAPDARLAIVEYGCYGSTHAAQDDRAFRGSLRLLLEQGHIRFALRHFPLVDANPHAWFAACAVEAATRQERFWDLHEALSQRLAHEGPTRHESAAVLAAARQVGLDVSQLEQDMGSAATTERVLDDFASGVRSGVNGTPCFFAQGVRQQVSQPGELVTRLQAALAGDSSSLWPPSDGRGPVRSARQGDPP